VSETTRVPSVYLDTNVYNRPFDDLSVPRNRLEAEAALAVFDLIERRSIGLAGSYILLREAVRSPDVLRRNEVLLLIRRAQKFVGPSADVQRRAQKYHDLSMKPRDALHVACAVHAAVDWFLTVDDRLLHRLARFSDEYKPMRCANPIAFVTMLGSRPDRTDAGPDVLA